jgi:acyl carrier protein
MDFLQLFNGVVKLAKPVSAKQSYATSLDDQLANLNLDSLDTIIVAMYFGEIYGVEEDVMQTIDATTVGELQAFMEARKTRTPENVSAELGRVK